MAVDARLLMSDTTPIAQGLASLGQGISGMMGQKRQMDLNRMAGQALMGDQGAMESLTMQAPDVAMGIQDRQRQQSERERQQQMQRQKALQGELVELAPGIASAPDLQTANARIRSELATGAYPLATSLAGDDGELDEQEWAMFKDIAAQQMGGTRVGKTDVLPDGTTIVATSRGPRVYSATGELLTGEDARDAIRQGQEFGADIQGLRSRQRREGGLEADIELGAEAEAEKERGKLETQRKLLPQVRAEIKEAEQAAKARGETFTELQRAKAAMPGLQQTVAELRRLAPLATSTMTGKAFNTVAKELGFGGTEGATARARFVALVDNQILPLLRDTFGAQFTEREGETLKRTMGDPDATPEEKMAQLDAFIQQKMRNLETDRRELEALGGGGQQQGTQQQPAQPAGGGQVRFLGFE